jgi:hypothetical protein
MAWIFPTVPHSPGQDPGGNGAPAWRALDPREAENALWVLRRHVLPLEPLSCTVDQAFLRSIAWPVQKHWSRTSRHRKRLDYTFY